MRQRGGVASAVSPDICDQIDPCSLAAMQGASRRWAAAARRGAVASERLLSSKRCGEAMVEEMCMILEKVIFLRKGIVADMIGNAICTVERPL